MNDAHRGRGANGLGAPGARISTGAVQLFRKYAGRGPSRAFTALDGDVVFILLEGTLTPSERQLIEMGEEKLVLESRRAFQKAMREELTELVETNVNRRVTAFVSLDNPNPDIALEMFVLDGSPFTRSPETGTPATPT